MDTVYIFYESSIPLGVFSDISELKEQGLNHILRFLIDKEIYSTKREAGEGNKSDLVKLFNKDNFGTEISIGGTEWKIENFQLDTIEVWENIEEEKSYETSFTKLKIKGRNCSQNDLKKSLAYLKLSPLYTM